MIALPMQIQAAQFDAPYYDLAKKNKKQWAQEDKQIDKKLKALEKKFGKKPNIIMVLSDDVGWGVLGAYGGGKVVGTPTPNLDKMARDGMKVPVSLLRAFLHAHSSSLTDWTSAAPHRGQRRAVARPEARPRCRGGHHR